MDKRLPNIALAVIFIIFGISLSACKESSRKSAIETKYDKNSQLKAEDFKTPPMCYRPVPFWSWNEVMSPEEVRRQIRLMKEAGWGGSMVHSRTGLITEYLGEEWFKAVDACLDESIKQNMLVWLYDEDKWPSGYSGGSVIKDDINNACKTLFARPVGTPVPPEATKLGEAVNGLQVYSFLARQGSPWYNGTSYADTMSKKAMTKFKNDAYDSYYNRYKDYYGDVIVAEFTDEPAQMCRGLYTSWTRSVVYSSDMLEGFKKLHGFDPVPHLYKLFTDCEGAMKFRLQYYRTADKLFEDNFVRLLSDACEDRRISLTGHFMAEGKVYTQQLWAGKIMPFYRYMGIPGVDYLGRKVDEIYTAKQCHSVCNQYGRMRMLSELYGCNGGSLTFEDRQWIGLQQITLGVNQFVPHLSLFSATGCRKRDFPQNFNYQQSWWSLNKEIDIPLARACYAMAQGKYATDILYISPQESAQAVWRTIPAKGGSADDSSPETQKKIEEIEISLQDTLKALMASQLTFDLGDEQIIQDDASVEGNVFRIKDMSYKLVLLSESVNMRPSTLKLLKEFTKNGGKVLRTGKAPEFLDGEKSEDLDNFMKGVKLVSLKDIGKEISDAVPPMIAIKKDSGNMEYLWTHIRNLNDGSRLVMLTNLSRKEKFEGSLKVLGNYKKAEILDINSGDITETYAKKTSDGLELALNIETADALFLRVSEEEPTVTKAKQVNIISKESLKDWNVERLDENSLVLDYASFRYDNGTKGIDKEVPAIEIMRTLSDIKYNGDVKVKYSFNVKDFDLTRKLHLVVEYPENAEIKVNGKEVKYAGLPFWKDVRWSPIDITGMVKEGVNTVEMHYKKFYFSDGATYRPQWKRYGTEIEAVYIVGDFSVVSVEKDTKLKNNYEETLKSKPIKTHVISKNDLAITNPKPLSFGDVTTKGLPFYAGKIKYSAKIDVPDLKKNERAFIKFGNLDCPIAEVFIDGKKAGVIKDTPFELDVTDYLKNKSANVEIIFYATMRNLMDALHNIQGDIHFIWPRYFFIEDRNRRDSMKTLKQFANGEWKSKTWIWDYCLVAFANPEKIELVKKEIQ